MANKTFCDMCGDQITEKNGYRRLVASVSRERIINGIDYSCDLCEHCWETLRMKIEHIPDPNDPLFNLRGNVYG